MRCIDCCLVPVPRENKATGAREGETVVISRVEWPDKEAGDTGMRKFTADSRMQVQDRPPTFDGRRFMAGGFTPMSGFE